MLKQLWNDEAGVIVSAEIVLVGTILVIGVATGLTSLRDGVVTELADVGGAIAALDQSYNIGGTTAHHSQNWGTNFRDLHDDCDLSDNSVGNNNRCLQICIGGQGGECRPVTGGTP